MAGSLLTMPSPGGDWPGFVTLVLGAIKGSLFVSLTNFTGTAEPAVEDGSYCDINGSQYKLTPNGSTEAIADLAAIANSSTIYFYAVPSGSSVTHTGSITAPTWSETKGGFYNGNNRCFGGCYKNSSGNYVQKWIIDSKSEVGINFAMTGDLNYKNNLIYKESSAGTTSYKNKICKLIEIGDWNMDFTANVNVAHGIGVTLLYSQVVRLGVVIRQNTSAGIYPVFEIAAFDPASYFYVLGTGGTLIYITMDSTNFNLARAGGGTFDNANFNSTSFNRGWIVIEYYE